MAILDGIHNIKTADPKPSYDVMDIIKNVCEQLELSFEDIRKKSKDRTLVKARCKERK